MTDTLVLELNDNIKNNDDSNIENTTKILQLKKEIEDVDTFHHVKILEVFKKHNISYSENRNGIFVNITNLSKNIVNEIRDVLKYVNTQEKQLQDMEQMKTTFKTTYFSNAQ